VFRASDRLPDRTRKSGLCPDCRLFGQEPDEDANLTSSSHTADRVDLVVISSAAGLCHNDIYKAYRS
jgi:hypothetical protein